MIVDDLDGEGVAACKPETDAPLVVDADAPLTRKYSQVVKLEIICADEDEPKFVELIRQQGHTGQKGDGMIFVSEVNEAVSIRTGRRGVEALSNADPEG